MANHTALGQRMLAMHEKISAGIPMKSGPWQMAHLPPEARRHLEELLFLEERRASYRGDIPMKAEVPTPVVSLADFMAHQKSAASENSGKLSGREFTYEAAKWSGEHLLLRGVRGLANDDCHHMLLNQQEARLELDGGSFRAWLVELEHGPEGVAMMRLLCARGGAGGGICKGNTFSASAVPVKPSLMMHQPSTTPDTYQVPERFRHAWLTPRTIRGLNTDRAAAAARTLPDKHHARDGFGQKRGPTWDAWQRDAAMLVELANTREEPVLLQVRHFHALGCVAPEQLFVWLAEPIC